MKYRLLSLLLLLFVAAGAQSAGDFPPAPNPVLPVNDYAKLLQADEVSRLNAKLSAYRDSTSTEIVIVTITDLKGYEAADYAQRLGELWGVGGKKDDNGVLILVSTNPRKLYIASGYGVEDRLTDALTTQISREVISPNFKQGNYYQGFDKGTTALIDALAGRYKAGPKAPSKDGFKTGLLVIFIIIVFIVLASKYGRGNGPKGGKRNLTDSWAGPIFWGSAWGSSGGSWGGSSGGGSSGWGSFGGGSFGGGGGGSDW